MTESSAPSLDVLLKSNDPAWLWDGERSRIVWANVAGTSWFGVENLFDLLDVRFDTDEESIATIKDLTERLPRAEEASVVLQFAAAASADQIACTCYIHTLADGRTGLLVCSTGAVQSIDNLPDNLQALALGAMPVPVCVLSGAGKVLFANQAMQELVLSQESYDFARQMMQGSLKVGLTSGLKTIATRHGKRDLQVLVRVLEKTDRLADASFLLTLDDVTERRALERSLLAGAGDVQPAAKTETQSITAKSKNKSGDTGNSGDSIDQEVSRALSAMRVEIENQQPSDDTKSHASKADKKESKESAVEDDTVPSIVSDALNNIDQPVILVDDQGVLLFGNDSSVKLMAVKKWQDIGEVTTLGDALAALEGEDGTISVLSANDDDLNLAVTISKFPWQGGPVHHARLTLESDGEKADNRRVPGQKKNTKKTLALQQTDDVVGNEISRGADRGADRGPSDDELRAILDTATDGIITLDKKGNICSFSAGAEALFGYDSAEVTGEAFSKLLTKDSCKIIDDYLQALSGSGLAAVFNDGREVVATVKQGGEISLFLTVGRLDTARSKAGVTVGTIDEGAAVFCVVVRDITQWKKTEAELRKSKESAEKSNAQKSLFLANISHELRTPLNAIMGFSEVMRSQRFGEIENEKYLAYANDIHSSGGHLLALINDLLDLAKIESGKLELNFTSVNLLNVIDETMHSLQEQATSNRILLRKATAGKLPNVVADMRSMKQILLNLLSNSVKFTKPGGQVIVATKLEDNGELLLTIKDTGQGMDEEQLQRALQPFQQIENAQKSDMAGTGLGLPLTKALVEANRASFTITSAPKKGTLVEIVFPTTRVLAE